MRRELLNPSGCLGSLQVAGGAQGPPQRGHLAAAPPHLCYGWEDGSPPAQAEQVHI